MIRSMTGYGRGTAELPGFRVTVELRSLNNRFADLKLRLPAPVLSREGEIRGLVLSRLRRGRVELDLRIDGSPGGVPVLTLNRSAVEAVVTAARSLRDEFGTRGELDLSTLLAVPGVLVSTLSSGELQDGERQAIREALGRALDALEAEREREGQVLREDLIPRVREMRSLCADIRERAAEMPAVLRRRLLDRLQVVAESVDLDPARLAQEAALLADRCDVTEELVRLAGHLEQIDRLVTEPDPEPVGKRLDFLLQEVHREATTINSKSADLEVTRRVLAFKTEAEKVREQVQNLE